MKKRLLMAFAATCMAMTGFALTNGEYVYTPQGRFHIKSANSNTNSSFANFSGWTVASASADKTIDQNFVINENGYASGINSVNSTGNTAGEGMYYKFNAAGENTYVVSFKMKGATTVTTRIKTVITSANLVKVETNSEGVYGGTTDPVIANTAEELSEEWQTFNYAIIGDGTSRTYFISFTGMDTSIEIADLQIAQADQVADLRQRDRMVEKINAYKNVYSWDEGLLADYLDPILADLEAVDDNTDQLDLDQMLVSAEETLAEFVAENMEDYLAGNSDNYLGIKTTSGNAQKLDKLGDWTAIPGGRGFWSSNAYPDLGHYVGNQQWAYDQPTAPMGISLNKELTTGSYVFGIESNAAIRENNGSNTWENNDGAKIADGVAYIAKVVDGEVTDTIASVWKGLEPVNYTPFIVAVKIEEDGVYEIGFKAYYKSAYHAVKAGGVVYVKDASVYGKNDNQYSQKELAYYENVMAQITTGRTNLTTAAEYIADNSYYWGKTDLQACVDTIAPRIAAYEAMSQDDIIATYEAWYEKSTSNENGLMEYEVYQTATKYIIAANRTFVAVNDTLNSLQSAINTAKETLTMRIYDAATGKAAFQTAIDNAEVELSGLRGLDYSPENAAKVQNEIEKLNEAIAAFKATAPAGVTIVDINFEQNATLNAETGLYRIAGNKGVMEFGTFSTQDAPVENSFEQGIWANGEHLYKGYLRVGNGDATVEFDPAEAGSMGTNILKVNFDFYLQGLSGRNVGVFLKDESGENNVAGFYANYYNSTIDTNTFGIELGSLQYASGSSYDDAAPEGAEGAGTYTCAKNSFEFIFDFGEKSMYCTTISSKGIVTTKKIAFDGTIPYSFVLRSNYNVASRRIWFDNLKIERIAAGPTDEFVDGDGIENVKTADEAPVKKVKKVIENGRIIIDGKYDVKGIQIK